MNIKKFLALISLTCAISSQKTQALDPVSLMLVGGAAVCGGISGIGAKRWWDGKQKTNETARVKTAADATLAVPKNPANKVLSIRPPLAWKFEQELATHTGGALGVHEELTASAALREQIVQDLRTQIDLAKKNNDEKESAHLGIKLDNVKPLWETDVAAVAVLKNHISSFQLRKESQVLRHAYDNMTVARAMQTANPFPALHGARQFENARKELAALQQKILEKNPSDTKELIEDTTPLLRHLNEGLAVITSRHDYKHELEEWKKQENQKKHLQSLNTQNEIELNKIRAAERQRARDEQEERTLQQQRLTAREEATKAREQQRLADTQARVCDTENRTLRNENLRLQQDARAYIVEIARLRAVAYAPSAPPADPVPAGMPATAPSADLPTYAQATAHPQTYTMPTKA